MVHAAQITKQGTGGGLDSDKLDGQQGTYYLDYNNFTNIPTIPTDHGDHDGLYLPLGGGTITGNLQVNGQVTQAGVVDRVSWGKTYAASNTNIVALTTNDGSALPTGGAYRVTGHISGTGTDQVSMAVFWNENGTWYCNNTFAGGTSSNHIEFLISDSVPKVKTWHTNNYSINVSHERLSLDEGSGNDNLRGYFGADSYLQWLESTNALTVPGTLDLTGTLTVDTGLSGNNDANRGFTATKTSLGAVHAAGGEGGITGSADTTPLITFPGSTAGQVQGGIYASQNSSTGTSISLFTTNSYSTGPKQGLSLYDNGDVEVHRGNIVMSSGATVDGVDISALPTSFAPTNAEENVQANWTETTATSDAFILNKPTIPTDHGDHDGLYLPIGGGTITGNINFDENRLEIFENAFIEGSGGQIDIGDIDGQDAVNGIAFHLMDQTIFSMNEDGAMLNGNLEFTSSTSQTTSADFGIVWTGWDKEGVTDLSDSAFIKHDTNVGGHSGSVLSISSMNDVDDGIAFSTHASSHLKHNGHALYSEGHKPTPAEIGAAATSHNHDGSYLDRYTGSSGCNNSSFTTAFTVNGGNLSSSIRFSVQGTSNSVVVQNLIDLVVGHSQDIQIKALSGNYTKLTVKVVSNNNEDFAVEVKHDGSTATTLYYEVFAYGDESVVFTNTHSFTGNSLEKELPYGNYMAGAGGDSGDLEINGIFRGNGSGITGVDAATVDGKNATDFANANHSHSNYITSNANDSASGSYSFTNSYNEFGNGTGSVSNDGGWNARVNVAGSTHARLDVKSVSDGIITTMFAHTGHAAGKIGTKSNHKLDLMINGTTKARLETNGTFRATGDIVAYYSFSDKRLKTNIKKTENNLDKILSLNPVEYTWKEGYREGIKEIGLIAQEVEEVVPEVVREQERLDEKEETYKTVDYEHLVSTLIGAMQEQQKQIDELKSQMAMYNAKSCKCKK